MSKPALSQKGRDPRMSDPPSSTVRWKRAPATALVSATQAEQVDVVEGPYRPALGIRTGSGYYFSLHGSSSGGGDAPTLLGNIDDAVAEHGNDDNTTYSWFALGDYNREPQAGGLGYVVCPPAAPTHPATSPTRYLDFMVRDSGVELTGHVLAVHLSDHLAVRFSFPPTTSSHQLAERNLRVMPLGDSITYGIGSATTSGYRAPLWDRLHGRARSLDFVGSQQSGQLPDRDNEGHSGAMISQIAGAADSSVPLMRPNVVTLHAGTNDMDRGDPGAAPDRLDGLIGQVLDDAPGTTVLVATLVPSTSETTQARITGFNREIRTLVAERQGAGQRVSLIDMSAVTTADLADYLHPNDTGYGKMADAFYRGIAAAVHDGWIEEPAAGEPGECRDTPNRWEERGRIAQGTGASLLDIDFADVDGDGRDDYLLLDTGGAVRAWLNRGGDPV
ncbi:GDSL-type esterase/lipase family protein [Streptomyces xinghaiensis]|uniref:GDSL-type esterase/lipase family protein n=1 Tax=Streptomyces xinghaiensis TaxID=1038928 RepID=UPI00379D2026